MKKYGIYLIVGVLSIGIFFLQFNNEKKYIPSTYYQVYLDNEVIGIIKSSDELRKYISNNGDLIKNKVNEYIIDVDRIASLEEVMKKTIVHQNDFYNMYSIMNNKKTTYLLLSKIVNDNGEINNIDEYNKISSEITDNFVLEDNKIVNYYKYVSNNDSEIKKIQGQITNYIYNNRYDLNLTSSEISNIEDYNSNKLNDINYSKYIYMKKYIEENKIYLSASDIYEPIGIYVKKISTYNDDIDSVEDVYNSIIEKKPCTIDGYQFKDQKRKGNCT